MQLLKTGIILGFLSILSACQQGGESGNANGAQSGNSAPNGYSRAFSPLPHNYTIAYFTRGQPVRFGSVSERFEVREGDCDVTDCSKPRARAEIQQLQDDIEAEIGKDIWYAWSFYNQSIPSFTAKNSLRLVFGQWTMGGTRPAIFRLMQLGQGEANFSNCDPNVCANIIPVQGDVVVQLDDIAKTYKWGASQNNGNICRLFDMTAQRGKWVDLIVNTNFSTSDDGYLRIWVNGQLVCNYSGPLVSQASVFERGERKPEHRRGIFSTWTNRWKSATGGAAIPQLVAYYDGFRTGTSFEDVNAIFKAERQVSENGTTYAADPTEQKAILDRKVGSFAREVTAKTAFTVALRAAGL